MTAAGFCEPQKFRPTGLALVVAMHVAALGALVLVKSPIFIKDRTTTMTAIPIPLPQDPPQEIPPQTEVEPPPQPTTFDLPPREVETTTKGPVTTQEPHEPIRLADAGTGTIGNDIPDLPPVRVDALFDPRFAADRQPPYPRSELDSQREGRVQLQVTIGADGRVKAVRRLSATSDAFWQSAERHALRRWRFRPATVDGRPVESTRILTIRFQIEV